MAAIFVNTNNNDPDYPIYDAVLAGTHVATAEGIMEKVVKKIISKTAGFTTAKTDNAKGYTIKFTLAKVEILEDATRVFVDGNLVRYPRKPSKKGDSGEIMVSTKFTGKAKVSGTDAMLIGIQSLCEDHVKVAIPEMRTDYPRS